MNLNLQGILDQCLAEISKEKKKIAVAFFDNCNDYNIDDSKELQVLKVEREGIAKAESVIKKVFRSYIKGG